MPCYQPLKGYRARHAGINGRRAITFNPKDGYVDLPVKLPCGQCIGCRLERSRQWAIRCSHEASLYKDNCFITLTYDDANIPPTGSLDISHFQKFMKRLRKKFGSNIRYYHCGEYGEKFRRPHYHACLFNFDFPDRILFKEKKTGKTIQKYYISAILQELWPFGFSLIGDVSFESAAYVARYILKKVTGEGAKNHYYSVDTETGEIYDLQPEYTTMSRRPGIGARWLEKYRSDVYPDDFVVIKGKKMKPPKYYDKKQEIEYPSDYAKIRGQRVRNAGKHAEDNKPERLKVRETVQRAKLKILKREME